MLRTLDILSCELIISSCQLNISREKLNILLTSIHCSMCRFPLSNIWHVLSSKNTYDEQLTLYYKSSQLDIFKAQIEKHHKTNVKFFFLKKKKNLLSDSRLRLVHFGRLYPHSSVRVRLSTGYSLYFPIYLFKSADIAKQISHPGLAKSHARRYHLFMMGYQKSSIFVSMLSSPVARKVIRATKHNNDLSTPGTSS